MHKLRRRRSLLFLGVTVIVVGVVGGGAYAATAGSAKSHARAHRSAICATTCAASLVVPFTLSPGQSKGVAQQGALTFTAVCNSNGSAEYDVTTTLAGSELDFGPQDRNFGPGTARAWGTQSQFEGNTNNGAMIAPDGSAILTSAIILSGTNQASFPGKCVFGGVITTGRGF